MAKRSLKDGVVEVSRAVREAQPAHYLFKIDSFSMIVEESIEKLESDDFEVEDYKWSLRLYLSGDKGSNETGYISLYLAIKDTDKLPHGWEVNVRFKFFVYNHIEDNYLTINDAGVKTRRFHAVKTEWGFSQLISLEEFNDTSNGYLFKDSCVFGAEIYVIKQSAKGGECISLIKEPSNRYFTWRVDNFLSITVDDLFSDEFTVGEQNWNLELYPKGPDNRGEWLSLFLYLSDSTSYPKNGVYVRYKLRIRDQISNKHYEKEGKGWFSSTSYSWGFPKLMKLSDVKDPSKGFLVKDTLIVEVEFMVLSVVKKLTGKRSYDLELAVGLLDYLRKKSPRQQPFKWGRISRGATNASHDTSRGAT